MDELIDLSWQTQPSDKIVLLPPTQLWKRSLNLEGGLSTGSDDICYQTSSLRQSLYNLMGLKGLQTTLFSLVAFCALYVIPSYFRLLQNEGLPHEKYSPYIHVGVERAEHFLNQWAVHISGGPDIAEQVAEDLGFHYKGILYALPNHYLFSKKDHEPISPAESISHTVRLLNDPRVMWTQQQFAKHLEKRNSENREIWRLSRMMEQKSYRKETGISKYAKAFTDELWPMQWYMQDCRSSNTSTRIDFNVVPVYQELNITGRGVNIIVLDDGIDYGHEDLAASFSPDLSYNFNNDTNDCRPRSSDSRNKHGTRCAGQLVMKPNNSKCGVGICYGAKVGGVKMLDGPSSDVIESKALQFGLDKADIYSGSWGPPDDGKYMDGPGKLCAAAFDRGIKEVSFGPVVGMMFGNKYHRYQ
ncbi:neuroendocrine convertase 1-like [Diaphorina citri]|uniref:Neuroendocrine convertase 1-like n=1 Tax=Diaphorina citri TaxID=121845 RepID=A0A3Q0IJK8_DIACI|nr:neuroendocrine convertase 1-like [Diaphorina citri]